MPYQSVLKAAFDYDTPGTDELAIKAGQLLLLLDGNDDECVSLASCPFRSDANETNLVPVGGGSSSSTLALKRYQVA
jgi:hypothetical protein